MARKRRLVSPVIVEEDEVEEVEVDEVEEQPTSESSDGEDDDGGENEEDEEGDDDEEDEEGEGEDGEDDEDEEDDEEESEGDEDGENDEIEDVKEDFSSKESIIKLLEPFGKDQLIEIFKGAAVTNSSLLSLVLEAADIDPVHRNIFVHGLSWDTTSETLSSVFSRFGKIEKCTAVTDHATGQCKGFGFVLFFSRDAAQNALKEPLKKIGNRIVSCQLASLGNPAAPKKFSQQPPSEATGRKIFVDNVGNNIKPESLLAFFSKFGEIERGPFGGDPETGKFRGYALFFYKTVEGCNKALEEPIKYFEGCKMQCRRALPVFNKKNSDLTQYAVPTASVPGGVQTNELALNYASSAPLMAQTGGVGLFNPAVGLSPAFVASAGSIGSANRGPGLGVNSISPSVIANYGSLAALRGLGAYHSTTDATIRHASGTGSYGAGGMPPFR